MAIARITAGSMFPEPFVFRIFGQVRLNRDLPAIDLNDRARLRQKVIVPGGVVLPAPVGANQEITTIRMEVGYRSNEMPA